MNAGFDFAKCPLSEAFAKDIVANLLLTSLQLNFYSLGRKGQLFLTFFSLLSRIPPDFLTPKLEVVRAVATRLIAWS